MMTLRALIIFFMILHSSCNQESSPSINWQLIEGRDDGRNLDRKPIYRAKVPENWISVSPAKNESITDTKKALHEWIIQEEDLIHIVAHNFPSDSFSQRIPPIAQVTRWKNQFDELDLIKTNVTQRSHGGFVGLFLEAQGVYENKPRCVLAWSMQLASCYYPQVVCKQKRADYTIKAWGSPSLMAKHKKAIIDFANSFELIEELP